MKEKEYPQIKILDETSRRNYCIVPIDEKVRNGLIEILDLEKQLSQDNLSAEQWERLVMRHVLLWSELPYYYKSELCDLSAITNFE